MFSEEHGCSLVAMKICDEEAGKQFDGQVGEQGGEQVIRLWPKLTSRRLWLTRKSTERKLVDK